MMTCIKPIVSSLCAAGTSSPATVSPLAQPDDLASVPEIKLTPAAASQTLFPSSSNTCVLDVVRVLTVHGHSGGKKMWSYLAKHWTDHGSVAIDVVSTNTVDLELLRRENPDVIVCSDIAGAPYQLSATELESLRAFVTETTGKHVLGTYATFYHREGTPNKPSIYDNRRLAPLFGFREDTDFGTRRVAQSPVFEPSVCPLLHTNTTCACFYPPFVTSEDVQPAFRDSVIWRRMPKEYRSFGYRSSQVPRFSRWLDEDGKVTCCNTRGDSQMRVIAKDSTGECVVTSFVAPSFSSIFISHMPEYGSLQYSKDDAQFLYNCLLYLAFQSCTRPLKELCISQLVAVIPALTQDELDKLPQDVKERVFLTLKHNASKCTLLALTRGYKVKQEKKQPSMEE